LLHFNKKEELMKKLSISCCLLGLALIVCPTGNPMIFSICLMRWNLFWTVCRQLRFTVYSLIGLGKNQWQSALCRLPD